MNKYTIKKLFAALRQEQSNILYVKKGIGTQWKADKLGGFYIDYSGKVSHRNFDENGIPLTKLSTGNFVPHTITIIQYGLGVYEHYLAGDIDSLRKVVTCADYLLETQNTDGAWAAYGFMNTDDILSSMVQGEAASLLLRAYVTTENEEYLLSAKKSIELMVKPISDGGTSSLYLGKLLLHENTKIMPILNGWIYSLFSLFDYRLATDDIIYQTYLESTLDGLKLLLPQYDRGYWSNYDLTKRIASPMYHDLHVKQLDVLYNIFEVPEFKEYADKWNGYSKSKIKRAWAIAVKIKQKFFASDKRVTIVE